MEESIYGNSLKIHTGCLKIRKFRIQSVVGDHFSSPNMEIKKKSEVSHKDTVVDKMKWDKS
jgi:hypothetical protein